MATEKTQELLDRFEALGLVKRVLETRELKFEPSSGFLDRYPEMRRFVGAEVHVSHPYQDQPVLHWFEEDDGTPVECVAYLFGHVRAEDKEQRMQEFKDSGKSLILGPTFHIRRDEEKGYVEPEFNEEHSGRVFSIWNNVLRLKVRSSRK